LLKFFWARTLFVAMVLTACSPLGHKALAGSQTTFIEAGVSYGTVPEDTAGGVLKIDGDRLFGGTGNIKMSIEF